MTKLRLMGLLLAAGAATAGMVTWPAAALLPDAAAQSPAGADTSARPSQEPESMEARVRRLEDRLAKLETGTTAGATVPVQPPPESVVAALAARFRYKIPFETGKTQFTEGGRLEILELWGTRPKVEIGGHYLVRGRYVLPSSEDGTLYFHETAANAADGWGAEMDLQHVTVAKGRGEFMLVHGMTVPGWFHLSLIGNNQGKHVWYADQYFGTGDNVYRDK